MTSPKNASVWLDQTAYRWFEQMTEDEKQIFEATMPTGLKQMLNAFEQMPEISGAGVTEAVQRLKTTRENFADR